MRMRTKDRRCHVSPTHRYGPAYAHAVVMAEDKSVKLSQLSLQQLDRIKAQLNEVSLHFFISGFTNTAASLSKRTRFYLVPLICRR